MGVDAILLLLTDNGRSACLISPTSASALFFSLLSPHTPMVARVFERICTMFEPLAGLAVAVLLGIYLVYTLLHPEKF